MNSYHMSPGVHARLARPQQMLIGNTWCGAQDGGVSDVYNPSNGEIISHAATATVNDCERAIAAARASFDAGLWTGLTPAQRARILWRAADLLEACGDEVAELEMLDAGKSFAGARNGEVP
ncbi:MAG: aldehyde dehydrogenase family protein, partial [Halioglobus sp.]